MANRRTPHIKLRRNTWFAVLDIPRTLRPAFGKTRFVQTLKTTSASDAARRVGPIIAGWQRQIAEAKGEPPADDAEFFRHALRDAPAGAMVQIREFGATTGGEVRHTAGGRPWRRGGVVQIEGRTVVAHDAILEHIEGRAEAIGATHVALGKPPSTAPEARAFYAAATGQGVATTATTAHLDRWLAGIRTTPKTKHMQRADVSRFAAEFPTLENVTKPAVKTWATTLTTVEGLAPRTVQRTLSSLRSYWRHLASLDLVLPDAVPFTGLDIARRGGRVRREDQRQPFTPAEVVKLLRAAEGDHQLVALIQLAMWTGARLEELARLRIADLTDHGSFMIREGKSRAAVREVPIHSKLAPVIRRLIGKRKDGYLLVSLEAATFGNRGTAIGKRFGRLKTREGFGKAHVFHSIRKAVATLLENAGVAESVSAAIIGHTHATLTYGLYSGGPSLAVKAAAIAKLTYPAA